MSGQFRVASEANLRDFSIKSAMMAPDATGGRYCSMLRPLLVVMVAVSLINVPLQAQNPGVRRLDDTHDKVLRSLGEYFESLRVQAGIPGLAATIVGPDEVIWEQALGRQDNERSIATRTDTPFHLDGLGQVITAALVLRCVEQLSYREIAQLLGVPDSTVETWIHRGRLRMRTLLQSGPPDDKKVKRLACLYPSLLPGDYRNDVC